MNYFDNLGVIIAGINFEIDFDTGKFHKIHRCSDIKTDSQDLQFPRAEVNRKWLNCYFDIFIISGNHLR